MNAQKEPILRAEGYVYNFDRMVYYNRATRKAFSADWVSDHTEEELRAAIAANSSDEWQLFVNIEPSQSVRDAFLAEISA